MKFSKCFDDEIARRRARQEAHRDGIVARLRQGHARGFGPVAEQRIGNLDQDAGAVAQQRIGAHRAAMVEIDENLQPWLMIVWLFAPLILATKPTPQASCSLRGS
jgi:hypothetical protein